MLQNQLYMCNWYSKCKTDLWVLTCTPNIRKAPFDETSNSTAIILKKPPYVRSIGTVSRKTYIIRKRPVVLLSQQYICVKIDSLYASTKATYGKKKADVYECQLPSSVCLQLQIVCYNLYKLMINYLYKHCDL